MSVALGILCRIYYVGLRKSALFDWLMRRIFMIRVQKQKSSPSLSGAVLAKN